MKGFLDCLLGTDRGNGVQNPLESIWGTVILGIVLTAVLYYIVVAILGG